MEVADSHDDVDQPVLVLGVVGFGQDGHGLEGGGVGQGEGLIYQHLFEVDEGAVHDGDLVAALTPVEVHDEEAVADFGEE